jgi:hypothetical protein
MQEVERLLKEVQKMQDERDQARQQVRMDRCQAEQASVSGDRALDCGLHAGQQYGCADFDNMQQGVHALWVLAHVMSRVSNTMSSFSQLHSPG